jgi:5,5'-dehydrodivanillate O-demethylase
MDDADRYGPMFEAVKDLHRRIEAAEIAARERANDVLVGAV